MAASPRSHIVADSPAKWRIDLESMIVAHRPLRNLPEHSPLSSSLAAILAADPAFHDVPVPLDKTKLLLKFASQLQAEIEKGWRTLEQAELKRREISSNVELIHGICDSQLAGKQRLTVFGKSINSICSPS
jgi:hypothetical protein